MSELEGSKVIRVHILPDGSDPPPTCAQFKPPSIVLHTSPPLYPTQISFEFPRATAIALMSWLNLTAGSVVAGESPFLTCFHAGLDALTLGVRHRRYPPASIALGLFGSR